MTDLSAPAPDCPRLLALSPGALFAGGGEMGALCRAFDWSSTALGPVEGWSHSLRTTVWTVLRSHHPMFLWWGPHLVQVYNDGYRPSLGEGGRHPRALGMRGAEFWTDIWEIIGPQIEGVMRDGTATWHEDQLVAIERNGRIEEVYWTYGYSPVPDDDGSVGGTLVVCQETTQRVIAQRRLAALHRLAARQPQGTARDAAAEAAASLAADALDVPFVECYLADGDGAPERVHREGLSREVAAERWPLREVFETRRPRVVDVRGWPAVAGAGPWPEAPERAVVLPLVPAGSGRVVGALVAGLSARLPWSAEYEDFLAGAANHVASQVAARQREAERALRDRELEVERERLAFAFRQAPTFLAVLRGPAHTFHLVNDAYYQLVGHRDLVGRAVLDALPEVRGQGFVELLDGVLRTGEPYVGREVSIVLRRAPGEAAETRFVDFVYLPLVDADGTRAGVIAHGVDVTDHVHARGEIERLLRESEAARAEAEEANRAKSQFLANMSHELRTPINAIIGYTELLKLELAGPVTPAQRGHLARVETSSAHLLGLVDDILDLARIEAGGMPVARRPHPVREAASAALAMIAPQAAARGLTVPERAEGPADAAYLGDADRVRQILVNLLSNAVKFTPAGGHVALRHRVTDAAPLATAAEGEGSWLAVEVEDDGIGIAAHHLSGIFDPFVQVDGTSTRKEGGTGLGLTISRKLARLMGGDLTVRSSPGAGSCFTLWLPAVRPAPSERETAAGVEPHRDV